MRCGAPVEGARGLVEGPAIPAPVDSGTGQDRVAGPAKSIPADGPMPAYTAPPGVPPATKWATPTGVAPQQQAVATRSSRLPALLIALAVLALIALTVVGGTVYLGYKVKLKAAAMLHQAEAAGVLGTARTDTQPVAGSDAEKPKLASKPASDSDAPGSVAMQLPLDNDAATKATQPSTESSQDLPSLASAPSAASAPSGCPAPPGAFGSDKKMDVSMEGKIYFLPNDTGQLPDFSKLKSEGSIYVSKWDVPERQFTLGFPGVTNRFEWFALDYQGDIYVPHSGSYKFRLGSDDGSILYLDDKKVLDNDGVHPWRDTDPTPSSFPKGIIAFD